MKTLEDDLVFIDFDNVHLDLENPRHEELDTQEEVIKFLCDNEQVRPLANHIVKNGLNPLEVFALVKIGEDTYISGEGNRRTCALKLLNDPNLAPKKEKSSFLKLHDEWGGIEKIPAIIFEDKADAAIWIELTHGGQQGGAGRRRWEPLQYSRFKGESANRLAQFIIEYALENRFLTKEQVDKKITTITRYFSNPIFRNVVGIDNSDTDNFKRTRSKDDFDSILNHFLKDLMEGKIVNSRQNKKSIEAYANGIINEVGVSDTKIESISFNASLGKTKKTSPSAIKNNSANTNISVTKPKSLSKTKNLPYNDNISRLLEDKCTRKLSALYRSICMVEISDDHTPLLTVGLWSFLESLSAVLHGSEIKFKDFFSHDRLANYGFSNKENRKAMVSVLQRVCDLGDMTKHNTTLANFNGEQLACDMEILNPLLQKSLEKHEN